MSGTLYLCATPIGNLSDVTLRVLDTLRSVDLVVAEDTRVTRKLFAHFDIHTPLESYHEHNADEKGPQLITRLLLGEDIALVTDAGTPAISDPGEKMVRLCIEEDIPVTSLPGPCACITALTLSGMDARRFVFEGFLPRDKKEQKEVLASLANETRTAILYEAPHRLKKTLELLYKTLGDREIALCRELTKKFETVERTTLEEAAEEADGAEIRGEYVLVIAGRPADEKKAEERAAWEMLSIEEHVALYETDGHDRKEAMRLAAKDRGISRRDVYNALL
ncbi:MAG: 16S rRNA (cytidine(1402)-2'-O)-methyltransferase [Lachnospiraceae bacterium]|nr:16S rRNA (cytidine(1402)-2'-O)-methyltransferase [Lachnospiraceae bacterium]